MAGILRLLLSTTTPCYPWLRIFDRALMRSFRCADQGGRPSSLEESSVVSFIATVNRKPKLYIYIRWASNRWAKITARNEESAFALSFERMNGQKRTAHTKEAVRINSQHNNCETVVVYFLNQTNISIEKIPDHERARYSTIYNDPPCVQARVTTYAFSKLSLNERSVPPRRIERYVANSR